MDVHCATCGEPWDTYHLRHDEIFETDLTYEEAQSWLDLKPADKLGDRYREKFRAVGWEFGQSVITVMRCPACPKDARPDPEQAAIKSEIESLLGDDEDGLAALYEDFGL